MRVLGEGTAVWDNVHIRRDAVIGDECIIGEKTYLGPDAVIGNLVKLNAMVYVPTGVTKRVPSPRTGNGSTSGEIPARGFPETHV